MGYDVALVCENGHEVNSSSLGNPSHNSKHCAKCGAKAINACVACGTTIRGYYESEGFVDLTAYRVPQYCHECGRAYPWTQAALDSAEELIRLSDDLSDSEKDALVGAVNDIATENPKTKVGAQKILLLGKKLGQASYQIMLEVVSDVASETAKKILGLKP